MARIVALPLRLLVLAMIRLRSLRGKHRRLHETKRRCGSCDRFWYAVRASRSIGRRRPVRIIVPFAAGATPDLVARLIADCLHDNSGRPSSSRTGRAPAAIPAPTRWPRPPPTARPSASASAARSPSTRCCSRKLPYDPQKDLSLITMLVTPAERTCGQRQPRREQRRRS